MTNNNMIFVANWKMHGNFNDISKVKTVLNLIKNKKYKKIKIIYCPPFTLLKSFSNYFKSLSNILLLNQGLRCLKSSLRLVKLEDITASNVGT